VGAGGTEVGKELPDAAKAKAARAETLVRAKTMMKERRRSMHSTTKSPLTDQRDTFTKRKSHVLQFKLDDKPSEKLEDSEKEVQEKEKEEVVSPTKSRKTILGRVQSMKILTPDKKGNRRSLLLFKADENTPSLFHAFVGKGKTKEKETNEKDTDIIEKETETIDEIDALTQKMNTEIDLENTVSEKEKPTTPVSPLKKTSRDGTESSPKPPIDKKQKSSRSTSLSGTTEKNIKSDRPNITTSNPELSTVSSAPALHTGETSIEELELTRKRSTKRNKSKKKVISPKESSSVLQPIDEGTKEKKDLDI